MDKYAELRAALAMGPTPGPWVQDGDGVSAADEDVAVAMCCPSDAEAAFIAACHPEAIRALLAERDALREALDELANGYAGSGWDIGLRQRLQKARAALAQGKP